MKAFKMVTDPKGIELLADETRRRIVYLLRAKEYTVSQLASEMNLTPQAIYHHIRKMKDLDLVEVAREERVDHFIETYYRATAEVFYCTHGEGSATCCQEEMTQDTIENLAEIGLNLKVDTKTLSRIVEMRQKMNKLGHDPDVEKKVVELDDVDFFAKQDLLEYANILAMSEEEFEEYIEMKKEYWKLLRSAMTQKSGSRKRK